MLYLLMCFIVFLVSSFIPIYLFAMDKPSFRTIYNTVGRDLKAFLIYLKILLFVKGCYYRNRTFLDIFHENVKKHPNNVCFLFEDEEWTFQQVNDLSNKIAHCFRLEGYQKGDEVALLMENCPEYVCIWLGLAKIGVISALINTNHKADSLAHSMSVIDMKGLIFGLSLSESVESAIPFLNRRDTTDFYCHSRKTEKWESTSFPSKYLNVLLEDAPSTPLDPEKFKANFQDKLMYIYTSGTTGLPKAAIIRHSRFLMLSVGAHYLSQFQKPQTIYNPLPMYHISGGITFLGVILIFGGKMVLRKKFSASNFWKEVVKHEVTVCQYIGEICRYLLNQPEVPEETQHSVCLMFGNGLKPHVWKEFQERFKIKRIVEVYAATEGNANLINMFGKVGAVGFVSRIISSLYPVFLIKVDPETSEVLRDKNGFCIKCQPGEPGELVGKVVSNNPINCFDGYVSKQDTEKKIVRDCFQKGDIAFLSGDILVMDEDGYLYFLDRAGDTFRWKGENISTCEVENIVSKVLNHVTCVVYGVEIPGTEGRAGMVAVQTDGQDIDFDNFFTSISAKLPTYGVPLFVRICSDIETTGTYKLRKVTYRKQGFNPEEISDSLYILDSKKHTYISLTKEIYSDVINGRLKL